MNPDNRRWSDVSGGPQFTFEASDPIHRQARQRIPFDRNHKEDTEPLWTNQLVLGGQYVLTGDKITHLMLFLGNGWTLDIIARVDRREEPYLEIAFEGT